MTYVLRPYQEQAIAAGVRALTTHAAGNGLMVEPVGSGKSLIIARIATQIGRPVLVFQPSKEILEQNASKLLAYGYDPAIYSASMGQKRIGALTLATIGSVKTVPEHFAGHRHIIVDEADLVNAKGGMYEAFFAALGPGVKVLGMTATPFRLNVDGYGGAKLKFLTRTRPRIFTHVVHYTQIGDLLKQGFLCPLTYHVVPGFDARKLLLNTTGADYNDLSVQRYFDLVNFREKTLRVVDRLLTRERRHILVFTRFVEDAEHLIADLQAQRPEVRTAIVTGETPTRERELILADFRAGRLQVVANVGVLVAGFDFPALDTVVLAHPTKSLRLYMQQVGRAVRTSPGKTEAWIVDMVGLTGLFGQIEDLVLRGGGVTGQQWEFVGAGGQVLTNTYLNGEPDPETRPVRRLSGRR